MELVWSTGGFLSSNGHEGAQVSTRVPSLTTTERRILRWSSVHSEPALDQSLVPYNEMVATFCQVHPHVQDTVFHF